MQVASMDVREKFAKVKDKMPKEAEKLLVRIEDTILTPAQLAYVDQLAITKASTRGTGTGESAGAGSGAAPYFSDMSTDHSTFAVTVHTFIMRSPRE